MDDLIQTLSPLIAAMQGNLTGEIGKIVTSNEWEHGLPTKLDGESVASLIRLIDTVQKQGNSISNTQRRQRNTEAYMEAQQSAKLTRLKAKLAQQLGKFNAKNGDARDAIADVTGTGSSAGGTALVSMLAGVLPPQLAAALGLASSLGFGIGDSIGYPEWSRREVERGGISAWLPYRREWRKYTDVFPQMYLPEDEDIATAEDEFRSRFGRSDNIATVLEGCIRQAELALLSRTVVGEMRN